MNEQLKSLIYYIKWLKHCGANRADVEERASDMERYIDQFLEDNPIGRRWRGENWTADGTPLPVAECNVEVNLDEAINSVYDVYFNEYVRRECQTEEERAAIRSDVSSFWKRLSSYMTPQNPRAYGLAVGRVQSGKTRNYIGLMFKAIDAGYNTIIILTSKSSRLAVQTHNRVGKWFGDEGLAVPNYNALTRVREDGAVVQWLGGQFAPNRINVGIVIKNERGHLANIRDWMGGMGPEALRSMKLLFIDDESDSATPNTNGASDPLIGNPDDVQNLANDVRRILHEGSEPIVEWMTGICEQDFTDEETVRMDELLRNANTDARLKAYILQNDEFMRLARLSGDVEINAVRHPLRDWVASAFDRRATRRQPLNRKRLRALFEYAFGIRQERSRINRSICELVGHCAQQPDIYGYGKMIYVGYTATPFANLLNEDPTTDPLCPDCIKPLSPSSKYFGLQRIFGGEGDVCNMDIVRTIEGDEYAGWVGALQDGFIKADDIDDVVAATLERNHNFAEDDQSEDVRVIEWESLKRAVMWAFCTAAARRVYRMSAGEGETGDYADIKYRWTTMLFNLSPLSNQDEGVQPVQQKLLQRYLEIRTAPDNREDFIRDCMAVWDDETSRFTIEDMARSCPGYGAVKEYPTRERIEEEIRTWFVERAGKWQVIQMNSAVDAASQADYNNPNCQRGDVLWFVCGGNAISRGLTLEGLTVSYYDRIKVSSSVDTITQMGRWFGYRPGYELLPRIWMTAETIREMKQICRVEESLHANLAELYGDEDARPLSIRAGVDVASVRFFGRRLSGRDANGAVFNGVSSKGIFKEVNGNGALAMGITRQFLGALGDVYPVQQYSTRPLNMRHRLFWRDVPSERISSYIGYMEQNYFSGASTYEAQGLLHEIGNSHCNWNVVVGNPDTNRHFEEEAGLFAGLGIRNNPFRRIGVEVSLGTGQLTSGAFLARMPDNLTEQALQHLNNPNVVPGDMRHVEEAYRLANETADIDRALLNPILLIDFTHGDGDIPYVQVSFYWYGRSEESYFRAVVNPRPSSDLFNRAVGIVQERHYISFHALCRLLGLSENDLSRDQLRDELRAESQNLTSAIGEVTQQEAAEALIQSNVFYSKEWARNTWPVANGLKIGNDLYQRILENHWNDYGASHLPNLHTLNQNYLDCIIMFAEADFSGLWRTFVNVYSTYKDYDLYLQEYLSLVQQWSACENEWQELNADIFPDGRKKDACKTRMYEICKRLEKMGAQGFVLAFYRLGVLCDHQNPDRARDYFENAARNMKRFVGHDGGDVELCLAEMYYYGRGVDQDCEEARRWCEKAQALGNTETAALLQQINNTDSV